MTEKGRVVIITNGRREFAIENKRSNSNRLSRKFEK